MGTWDLIEPPFVSGHKVQTFLRVSTTLLAAPALTRRLRGGTASSLSPATLTTAMAGHGPALLDSGRLFTSWGCRLSLTHLPRLDLWVGTVVAFEFGCLKHVVNVLEGIDAHRRASPAGSETTRGSAGHWPPPLRLGGRWVGWGTAVCLTPSLTVPTLAVSHAERLKG